MLISRMASASHNNNNTAINEEERPTTANSNSNNTGEDNGDDNIPQLFNSVSDIENRRKLRQKYRDAIRQTQKESKELAAPSDERLLHKVNESTELFKNVRQTREGALDAQFLKLTSDISREKADAFQAESIIFDDKMFSSNLRAIMSQYGASSSSVKNPLMWNKIFPYCNTLHLKKAPGFTTLFGCLELTLPTQTPSQKTHTTNRASQKDQIAVKPKEVQSEEIDTSIDTKKSVEWIYKCLRVACEEENKVFIWHFIIDPTSFSITAENLFHLTFLIKDGRCEVFEEDQNVYLRAAKQRTEGDLRTANNEQVIFSLNLERWEKLIKDYDITQSYIPSMPAN